MRKCGNKAGLSVIITGANSGIGFEAANAFAKPMGLRLVLLTDAWARRRMFVCVRQYASLPAPARLLVDSLVPKTGVRP